MPISKIKSDGINDAAITTAKLADSAVNSAKIGVDVIAAEDLAANSVTVSEISNGAVTSAKLDTNIAIAGNLTVDTNTLYVDSTNNRVGINTTTPNTSLHILAGSSGGSLTNAFEITDTGYTNIQMLSGGADGEIKIGAAGQLRGSYKAQYAGTSGSYNFNIGTNNTNAITIDTSQKVGIGVPSPSAVLDVKSSGTTSTAFRVLKSNANTNLHAMTEIGGHGRLSVYNDVEGEGIRLDSNGTSIFNGGGVSIGTSSPISGVMLDIRPTSTTRIINTRNFSTAIQYHHFFENSSGAAIGAIQCNNTSTAYNTTSDYRLKTAVNYDWDATTRLKQLKPARFEWIADGDDAVPVDGFLAHEVQDIVPEAISGTKDAVDEDGNPEYQGIDQSKLVPLLVKTIQELEARIAALENT